MRRKEKFRFQIASRSISIIRWRKWWGKRSEGITHWGSSQREFLGLIIDTSKMFLDALTKFKDEYFGTNNEIMHSNFGLQPNPSFGIVPVIWEDLSAKA